MYNRLTEEEEYAIYKGYLAGRPANEKDPSETYKDKTVLLGCWYWGYNRTKSHKTIQQLLGNWCALYVFVTLMTGTYATMTESTGKLQLIEMSLPGFFDLNDRYQKLNERDPLLSLNELIDWEEFRDTL